MTKTYKLTLSQILLIIQMTMMLMMLLNVNIMWRYEREIREKDNKISELEKE